MKKLTESNPYDWGDIVYNAHSVFGPRLQADFQLVLVHSGMANIRVDGEEIMVRSGEVALLFPGHEEYFRFSSDEPTHHSWIHCDPAQENDPLTDLVTSRTIVVPISKRLDLVMKDLLRFGDPVGRIENSLCRALAKTAFCDVLFESGIPLEQPVPGHPSVSRGISILKSRYKENLRLPDIARSCGLSSQHLSRLFLEETGKTPMRFLWQIREDEGRKLLRQTGLTVAEIAEFCGFQNPFHFTRRIRDRFGKPPRELRKQDWASA